ncbi:MAG TPA: isoleucine--tRNA ligase [Actinomycetota bacterium]|nr:isoleucine--tRNA ligase [Actinomycetota bacterium]
MPGDRYRPVDARVSWPEMEARVMRFWAEGDVCRRSLDAGGDRPEWVFYEGPPTANGKPGIHHVEARAFKDLFCRFQTMRGHHVHRKGGWDCHGLPVEIEVEKELGITAKRQIEDEVGIEEFVRRCRASVRRYVDDWERVTERLGFWIDLDDAYQTMSRDYVESVWWLLKQIWDKGLLEEDFKTVPYCPRCETSLSSHEQHQPGAYQTVTDPSVYVRFPLADDPATALLVWTTTPWTLLANMAVAVGPDVEYATVPDPELPGRLLVVASDRVAALLGDGVDAVATTAGRDLVGRRYEPPFPFVPSGERGHRVRPGDFVATDEGSGLVHLAPYGEDDMAVAKRDDLPIVQIIDSSGRVAPEGGEFAGLWFKDADERIVEQLRAHDRLFRSEPYEHAYPHCWRCKTPLIYYARKDWYVRTSQMRGELQASNEDVTWQPPTIKHGRFGDWLANNVDWSLSRDRYWGTPLPVWRCARGHATCVGSFAELSERAGRDVSDVDPHRPFVDDIEIACPECGERARRVPSVIDAWFDSGSMPFAQWHYPFENEDVFERRFPADFISEAIDQTRGWFYSLLAIATLVRGQSSYRNVVCLGLLLDGEGRKMSKSLGNIVDPWTVFDAQGADPLRWYMLTAGTPWSARRVSLDIVEEALRKYLLTLWNTYSFWVTYASLEGYEPGTSDVPVSERGEMDRWILAELYDTVRESTGALEAFDATRAGRRIERFVDDLSNWYVRRSRRRFWRSGHDADTRAAFATLWECLVAVAKLTAPFTPFVADEIYTNLTGPLDDAPPSVHLASWPEVGNDRADDGLRRRMALARKLVTLGRAARTDAKVRVRQPLRRALVVMPAADAELLSGLEPLVAEELNVKDVEVARGLEELVSYEVKPNFKALGPRFGARVKAIAAALARADAGALVGELERRGRVSLDVDGDAVELVPDDLDVRIEGRAGFALAREGAHGVALDVELTPALVGEGIAREVVRAVQDLRKAAGLRVDDRIELWLAPDGRVAADALQRHSGYVADEVLATDVRLDGDGPPDAARGDVVVDDGRVAFALQRAG